MALISPILDDRTYEQLREELVKRIPVYAPEWTNHNESDPGIALLELFAYLGESLLYRFNQIPDTTKIAFLRLLGVAPRPARPARALIVASTDLAEGVPVPREAEAKAGSVSFATEADIQVWPLDLVAAGKTPAPEAVTRADRDRREDAANRLALAAADPKTFYETTPRPNRSRTAGRAGARRRRHHRPVAVDCVAAQADHRHRAAGRPQRLHRTRVRRTGRTAV